MIISIFNPGTTDTNNVLFNIWRKKNETLLAMDSESKEKFWEYTIKESNRILFGITLWAI